jgi:dsDNA-specific endonuclease/ATPase MutS2
MQLENLLRRVEADAQKLATEREALEHELAAARQGRYEAEAALRTAHGEARDVKTKAKAEAREVLASLRQKLRELSRAEALDRAEAKKTAAEIEAQTRRLEPTEPEQAPDIPAFMLDLHSGDRVRIPRLNRAATVLASARGILELDVDGKKVRLSAREVMPIECLRRQQNGPGVQSRGWSADLAVDENPSDRINIIGLRVDEGLLKWNASSTGQA